jgi:hypothetical protein
VVFCGRETPRCFQGKGQGMDWRGITQKFDIKSKPVRWLGFFLGCRFNWQAHVKQAGTMTRLLPRLSVQLAGPCQASPGPWASQDPQIMNANGVPRRLARKIAWAVSMSTAAYVIEAIWEDQAWLLNRFNKLTTAIGRAVAGTFSTTKGEYAIRAADIPHSASLGSQKGMATGVRLSLPQEGSAPPRG